MKFRLVINNSQPAQRRGVGVNNLFIPPKISQTKRTEYSHSLTHSFTRSASQSVKSHEIYISNRTTFIFVLKKKDQI